MPFTAVMATDRVENDNVQNLRKRITFASPTTVNITVGALPAGAAVIGGAIIVSQAFNGTTPVINIGATLASTGVNTAAVWASAVDVTTVGLKALDDLAAASANNYNDTVELTVTANLTVTGSPTTGVADLIIMFVTKPVV